MKRTSRAQHEPQNLHGLLQHYLKDLVYGANDGIITTFAVVAGATGATLSASVILILGFANLLGDGFSMGASSYLSIQSDEDVRRSQGREGVEPFPLRHAAATFLAFVVAGTVPLLSYVVLPHEDTFATAACAALATLFVVGSMRAVVTNKSWWRSGLEMLAVGAVAAAVAFGVGDWLSALLRS